MDWRDENLDALAAHPCCGYGGDSPASEPTALAALALAAGGRQEPAVRAADFLAQSQAADGSVGVRRGEPEPRWPTSLAVLAWLAVEGRAADDRSYRRQIDRALAWILSFEGKSLEPTEAAGHDPTLIAWPWVEGTHSWVEPTALHIVALKAARHAPHPRVREAVRLLFDRQIPGGGWNYGNTFILGQKLRPHLQPTGMALLALAGEGEADRRTRQSLDYLEGSLSPRTPAMSLGWGLLGLAAHDRAPRGADQWLERVYRREDGASLSPIKRALLALAAEGPDALLCRSVSPRLTSRAKSRLLSQRLRDL